MSSCKLYETIVKSNLTLDEDHNPTSYDVGEKFKDFYDVYCPPSDCRLQNNLISGWQKYALYIIKDKECTLSSNGCRVLSILHLINSSKVDDIVIFRIVKKNKNDDSMSIRYMCCQLDKKNLCANISQLNNYLDKKCQYVGRKITKEDFENV